MTNKTCRYAVAAVAAVQLACGSPSGSDGGAGGGGAPPTALQPFTPPSSPSVANSFLVTVTGESAAVEGTAFPPAGAGDPYFVDGWELSYEHVIVVVDKVSLAENPDLNPADQSQTGSVVAEATGPWAVDLAKGGPLTSKEMNGKSVALTRVLNQNKKAGTPAFSPTAKYAFGFDLIGATYEAQNVNLDAAGVAAYDTMVQKGWSVWLNGTATWRGNAGTPACRTTNATYDFGRVPKSVNFSFGFAAPVTFKNCVNPELMPADSRGVQSQSNAQTVAQVTFHLDHPFWEALQEDAPLRWDAIAARKSVASGAAPAASVTEADVIGLDFQAFKDAQNNSLPIRSCGATSAGEPSSGALSYDPNGVPVSPSGGEAGLKDLYDYMTYNLSTMGHLNNDGLCFAQRNFAAPR